MRSTYLHKLFIILIIINCKDSNLRDLSSKDNSLPVKEKLEILSEKDSFTLNDFKNVIQLAKKFHLDGEKINDSVALADAASSAIENLDKNLYFYSEEYLKNLEETNISEGIIYKTNPNDSFVLLKLNTDSNSQNALGRSPKEHAQNILKQKQEIFNSLVKLKFTEDDFERVISYISQNYQNIFKEEKPLALMNNLYYAAANGYLRSLDPYSIITKVNLDDNNPSPNTLDMKSEEISGRYLPDDKFIYLRIPSFRKTGDEDSVQSIQKVFSKIQNDISTKKVSVKGLILDLRDNTGGYLNQAIETVDLFIEQGEIISTKMRNKSKETFYAKNSIITKLPISILVNSNTVSGAEIVAGSLQENKRAIIFGERTFGNGSIQKLMTLPDNTSFVLMVIVSRYFLPSGISTQVNGIIPDILISSEEDGSFPQRLREEDKWKHLPSIKNEKEFKSNYNVDKIAEVFQTKNKSNFEMSEFKMHGKPDYALIRSLNAFNAFLEVHHK